MKRPMNNRQYPLVPPTVVLRRDLRFVCLGVAVLVGLLQAGPAARSCGLEDPSSVSFQRGILNWSYPNSLYVWGALSQAVAGRIIEPPAPVVKDPFGSRFRKVAEMLRQFGAGLKPDDADDFAFTLVLIEPMLWTRYTVRGGSVTTSVHVKGPEKDDLVVVSAEVALKEIVSYRWTFQRAEALGLIRFYGDSEKSTRLRALAVGWQEAL